MFDHNIDPKNYTAQSNYSADTRRYPIMAGMRVFVYRNLNKMKADARPVFSVQSRASVQVKGFSHLSYGRVFHHANGILLRNCSFHVSEKGWYRVQESGVKNVHAGILGELVDWTSQHVIEGETLAYNPRNGPHFQTQSGDIVTFAREVYVGGVYNEKRWSSVILVSR